MNLNKYFPTDFEFKYSLLNLHFQTSGELSAASPERMSMASPGNVRGKRVHNHLSYSSDLNQSRNSCPSQTMHTFI